MPSRLTLALDQGLIALPQAGQLGVLNAPADLDLADTGRVIASQPVVMTHDILERRGITMVDRPSNLAGAIIYCHRSKPATLDMIAQAVQQTTPGGLICVEGAKTDGIESVLKRLRTRFEPVESFSKAHGKLIWFSARDQDVGDWIARPTTLPGGFTTLPGVFSADRIDKGSALLVAHLPPLSGRIADFGAGWGYLARHVLGSDKAVSLDLVEADRIALTAAQRNITDPRARFEWADVLTLSASKYDAIVMNPPFHATRKPDATLGQGFIRQAARHLVPNGVLWMVANRNLPYEQVLSDSFAHVETTAQQDGFKVITARKPKNARAKG